MSLMDEMIGQVRDYLDENDWHYEYENDRHLIRAGVNLNCKLKEVRLYVNFNEGGYTSIATVNMKADSNCMANILEYITRANYGLRNGNFEVDMRDGEIRYKCYTNFKGMNTLSNDVIEDSIMIPPMMFNRYGDGLAALLLGFSDPETEIRKVEEK